MNFSQQQNNWSPLVREVEENILLSHILLKLLLQPASSTQTPSFLTLSFNCWMIFLLFTNFSLSMQCSNSLWDSQYWVYFPGLQTWIKLSKLWWVENSCQTTDIKCWIWVIGWQIKILIIQKQKISKNDFYVIMLS